MKVKKSNKKGAFVLIQTNSGDKLIYGFSKKIKAQGFIKRHQIKDASVESIKSLEAHNNSILWDALENDGNFFTPKCFSKDEYEQILNE